jgi:hypothetical protein
LDSNNILNNNGKNVKKSLVQPIKITTQTIRHGLDGNRSRIYTNSRLGGKIGEVVKYAIPINGLKNSKTTKADGTYAMAGLSRGSDGKDYVCILTFEYYSNNVTDIESYKVAHSINGSINKKSETNGLALSLRDYNPNTNVSDTISVADFLDIVKHTHGSILSKNALNALDIVI